MECKHGLVITVGLDCAAITSCGLWVYILELPIWSISKPDEWSSAMPLLVTVPLQRVTYMDWMVLC